MEQRTDSLRKQANGTMDTQHIAQGKEREYG